MVSQQSSWYGVRARNNRLVYIILKSIQIIFAAAIPIVSVAHAGELQRWINATLGSLIGIVEGIIQLGQYQQNWLLYRATREALKREELLRSGKAGPYSVASNPDTLYIERSDAIISGEHSKWLASQEQGTSQKQSGQTEET
jgi:hypothetical protein